MHGGFPPDQAFNKILVDAEDGDDDYDDAMLAYNQILFCNTFMQLLTSEAGSLMSVVCEFIRYT